MSMYLNFEPHSYYKHFAIRHYTSPSEESLPNAFDWYAYTDDGNTYRIIELKADTLRELKEKITKYWEDRK